MGKTGFEIEIGGMQFSQGFENSITLAVFQRGEKDFFRMEAEGGKVLGGKSSYPEIVSAPYTTKDDIRFFFETIKKFCMKAGESTFGESIKILEEYVGSKAKENMYGSLKYLIRVKEKNPSIQTNLSIPYGTLCDLNLGDDFEKAKSIAKEIVKKYNKELENELDIRFEKKLMSFLTQLSYQTYVYTKNRIVPAIFYYDSCYINEKMLEEVELHKAAATGTKSSNAKLYFDVLLKTCQAEVLNTIFEKEERGIVLAALDGYKEEWGQKFENARGGMPVFADSYAFAKVRQGVEQNIAACNGKEGAKFVFTEPRIASVIGVGDGEIVIELRKSTNSVNALLRDYCDCKKNKELAYIDNLFPLLKKEYGVDFPET